MFGLTNVLGAPLTTGQFALDATSLVQHQVTHEVVLPDLGDAGMAIVSDNTRATGPLYLSGIVEDLKFGHDLIDAFNAAFQRHDPALLPPLIALDCVLENTQPAPNGSRHVGRDACLAVWQGVASNAGIDSNWKAPTRTTTAPSSCGGCSGVKAKQTPYAAQTSCGYVMV